MMDMLINLIVVMISQYTPISNHHTTYLECMQFWGVNYAPIKPKKKKKEKEAHQGDLSTEASGGTELFACWVGTDV